MLHHRLNINLRRYRLLRRSASRLRRLWPRRRLWPHDLSRGAAAGERRPAPAAALPARPAAQRVPLLRRAEGALRGATGVAALLAFAGASHIDLDGEANEENGLENCATESQRRYEQETDKDENGSVGASVKKIKS